jgi:hypothetical protein
MVRKIINRSAPGTSDTYGADDLGYVNKLLTGEDQSATDPVSINTTWTFRSSKLRQANPANTFFYTLVPSAIGGNRNVTLPLLTANDTFAFLNASQTLTNKTIDGTQNTLVNLAQAQGVAPDGELRKAGGWMGGHPGAVWGMYTRLASVALMDDSGGAASTVTSAEGKHTPFTTGTTAGNDAGWYSNAASNVVTGRIGTRFKCKFQLTGTTSNTRLFVGLSSQFGPAFLTGDTPLNNQSGILAFKSAAGTNFQLCRNDGDATQDTDINLGVVDTNPHTIEIKATADTLNWQYSWDNNPTFTTITSEKPGQDTLLHPYISIETSSGARTANFYYWLVECNT